VLVLSVRVVDVGCDVCDEYRKIKDDLNQGEARAGHLGASDAHAQVSSSQAQFKPRGRGAGHGRQGLAGAGAAARPRHDKQKGGYNRPPCKCQAVFGVVGALTSVESCVGQVSRTRCIKVGERVW